jgi:hypothetical protein
LKELIHFRRLEIIFVHIVVKHFRHQDTKTQRQIKATRFVWWLCVFVAIFPADPGLVPFTNSTYKM